MSTNSWVAIIALAVVLSAWTVIRIIRPDVEARLRFFAVAVAAAIAGAFSMSFSRQQQKKSELPDKKEKERYETTDNFEDFSAHSGDLLPAPPPRDLDDELADFRSGAGELVGHNPNK